MQHIPAIAGLPETANSSFCENASYGSLILFLLLPMIMISVLSLVIQCMQTQETMRRLRPGKPSCTNLCNSRKHRLSCLDPSNHCDFPFHTVKQLSGEMSMATRNYLKRKEDAYAMDIQMISQGRSALDK